MSLRAHDCAGDSMKIGSDVNGMCILGSPPSVGDMPKSCTACLGIGDCEILSETCTPKDLLAQTGVAGKPETARTRGSSLEKSSMLGQRRKRFPKIMLLRLSGMGDGLWMGVRLILNYLSLNRKALLIFFESF
mmetsp:Transcript_27582/g.36847  ORF Transcript_27582/g.36847 Transcript_27582/m.36847 type:complete len:133 (-) Transcript_27582:771-1169(-)